MQITVEEHGGMQEAAGAVLRFLKEKRGSNHATTLALYGDLGAGKTTFVQALAEKLGVADTVTSPTFLLLRSYDTPDPNFHTLIHIDAYRLDSPKELVHLEWGEQVGRSGVLICVEWADRVESILPKDTIRLQFEHLEESKRKITLL